MTTSNRSFSSLDTGTQMAGAGQPQEAPSAPVTQRLPELEEAVRRKLPGHDPEALQTFFDHYFDRIYGYLRRLVRSEHLAEDLAQEVFLHVHRALPRYDPERPLSPWVFTIAMNKVRDHWRSRRVQESRRITSVDDEMSSLELKSGELSPSAVLQAGEAADAVAAAVADLPEMLQQTFVLRFYEKLSFEEIGVMVNRNETAVRKRYSRALGELREALADIQP